MNLVEFNALKAGDRIDNAMSGSVGEVVEASTTGVRVKWSGTDFLAREGVGTTRHYSVHSTIWFHWSKVEEITGAEMDAIEAAAVAGKPLVEGS